MTESSSPQKSINISEGPESDSPRLSNEKEKHSEHTAPKSYLKGSFVTGANYYSKPYDNKPKINEVYDYHDRLNGLVDQLDDKVKILLNENQAHFLMAYKEQMMHIQKELKMLKKKVDEETYKRKNNERMNILEQERDWFRAEAIRLDKVCKEQQKSLQELKFSLKMVSEDKSYYEEFILNTKKENKALKEELMHYEMGRKTADDIPLESQSGKSRSPKKRNLSEMNRNVFTPRKETTTDERRLYSTENNRQIVSINEEKLLEVIKQMKLDLDKEKKVVRQLRQEKSQMLANRIEFEQILVESINEVKRDIAKRRNMKTFKSLNRGPNVPEEIDPTKFSATDKKNLLEIFLSNEIVLEELYNIVFGPGGSANRQQYAQTPSEGERRANTTGPLLSNKSDGRLKYGFNYGFGNSNIRIPSRELDNLAISRQGQTLMGELKRPDIKKLEAMRRDL